MISFLEVPLMFGTCATRGGSAISLLHVDAGTTQRVAAVAFRKYAIGLIADLLEPLLAEVAHEGDGIADVRNILGGDVIADHVDAVELVAVAALGDSPEETGAVASLDELVALEADGVLVHDL